MRPDLLSAPTPTVSRMDRISYVDVGELVDRLLLAHEAEIRGGRTEELRAATAQARAELDVLLYAITDRPPRPTEPEHDPLLPKRRPAR